MTKKLAARRECFRQLSDDDEIDSSAKQRWESIENYRPKKNKTTET
jgi:hypothetical protein